jgi:hypothetical protein
MRQILLLMGYAVFIFQAGIFIYHALRAFHYQGPVRMNIWIPMLVVLGIYILRHTVIRYLRWLFNNQKEMTLFGFDISIFNTMVGTGARADQCIAVIWAGIDSQTADYHRYCGIHRRLPDEAAAVDADCPGINRPQLVSLFYLSLRRRNPAHLGSFEVFW